MGEVAESDLLSSIGGQGLGVRGMILRGVYVAEGN